jgi:hypothetical protein
MIKKFLSLFFKNDIDVEKEKKLKEIDKQIGECKTYKELVVLVNLYNKIKYENKAD